MMTRHNPEKRAAFTLIEMMVVVAIIGILIAGVFRLLGAAGENNKKAVTVSRLQKLQNALSGFYAEYGTYPPVKSHRNPDPWSSRDAGGEYKKGGKLDGGNASAAAASQPMTFEYPNVQSLDDFVNTYFQKDGIQSVNQVLGGVKNLEDDWEKAQIFKFGLLSFLLPRVELMGAEELATSREGPMTPRLNFFKGAQWSMNNSGELMAQRARENHAVARWLPNFEGCLFGGYSIMGIDTAERDAGGPWFTGVNQYPIGGGGPKYVLIGITMRDGWGSELYYYSAPPYQSYRVWSAGPNGLTFPPWISLESLSQSDRKLVTSWIGDDIIRFDH